LTKKKKTPLPTAWLKLLRHIRLSSTAQHRGKEKRFREIKSMEGISEEKKEGVRENRRGKRKSDEGV
jgi:hypothetical protein